MNSAEAKRERVQDEQGVASEKSRTAPPRARPIMRFSDQVVEDRVFAKTTSSFPTMLGSPSFAPVQKTQPAGFRNQQRIHPSTPLPSSARTACRNNQHAPRSATIITCFAQPIVDHASSRPTRSEAGLGSTSASATEPARPVSSAAGEDGQGVEPVTNFADYLCSPKAPEIGIPAQQAQVGRQRNIGDAQFWSRFPLERFLSGSTGYRNEYGSESNSFGTNCARDCTPLPLHFGKFVILTKNVMFHR